MSLIDSIRFAFSLGGSSFVRYFRIRIAQRWTTLTRRTSSSVNTKRNWRRNSEYQSLESRAMLAAIIFDSATGNLTLAGDGANNSGSVTEIGSDQVRATLTGATPQTFSKSEVAHVTFIGFGGDDEFSNVTSLPSFQYGGDGNDRLTGGSGDDVINGGRGNDQIFGLAGNDRLVANAGNDIVEGGSGDDRINGTSGTNTLRGQDGDDVIYGGNQADTIFGGDGIDQIFGLAGNDILDSGNGGVIGSTGVGQADLVLGLDGDDQIAGGDGLNVFWGGRGRDTLIGGRNAENRLHGQDHVDALTGGNLGDYLAGGDQNDTINGLGGADFIVSGQGNDLVDGGSGIDVSIFVDGDRQYRINGTNTLTVRDMRDIDANEGTDTIGNVERFRFANGTQAAASPILERVTVRPIVTSNNNGSNTATFFGTPAQEAEIKAVIDDILYQANVDVAWEGKRSWNNTFANQGNGGQRPNGDLSTIVTSGDNANVGSSNPLIIDAYFVQISAGFGSTGDNVANGLAFVGANGTTIHVGDNLVDFNAGREVVAKVVAHEIAHNLGLVHVTAPDNLMDKGRNLNSSQTNTILASQFTVPV